MKIKARSVLTQSMKLVRNDMWRYVAIFSLAETMALLFMRQISSRIFNLVLINAKIQGITDQNFMAVLKSPIALFLLLLVLLLMASFVVIQFTVVLAFADRAYHGKKVTFNSVFKPVIKMRISHFFVLLLYIFIVMPLGNIGLTSAITANLRIPSFIIDHIASIQWMNIAYYCTLVVLFYLNIRTFFTFIIFYNEKLSFLDSIKKSWNLSKRHSFLIIRIILIIAFYTLISGSIVLVVTLVPTIVVGEIAPQYLRITNSISSTAFLFASTFIISLSSIALVQTMVVSYHQLRGEVPLQKEPLYKPKRHEWLVNIVVILAFAVFTTLVYFDSPNHDLLGKVFIVSHRGESRLAVENTIESLEIANQNHPDYVEMDVQQLADGTIVVFHDSDLKRLAGINRKLNSYTLAELKALEISSNGHVSTIPTLDDYLERAHELDQKIMIEIKTNTDDSPSFLEDIMISVRKYRMEHKVIYQSLDKAAILKYKELYPYATVGYILGINIGGLEPMDVDFFSLEDFSLTTRVVRDAQRMRKGLFVWTVNTQELMEVYFKTDVSGIITDNIELANRVREEMSLNPVSDLFWNWSTLHQ